MRSFLLLTCTFLILLTISCRKTADSTPARTDTAVATQAIAQQPTATPEPTRTPTPKPTDTPTPTPTATNTPIPPTPTPTPTIAVTATPSATSATSNQPQSIKEITVTEADVLLIVTTLAEQQGLPLSGNTQATIDDGLIGAVDKISILGLSVRTEVVARPSIVQGNVVVDIEKAVSANQPLPDGIVSQLKQAIEQGIMAELRNSFGCEELLTIVAEAGQLVATCR